MKNNHLIAMAALILTCSLTSGFTAKAQENKDLEKENISSMLLEDVSKTDIINLQKETNTYGTALDIEENFKKETLTYGAALASEESETDVFEYYSIYKGEHVTEDGNFSYVIANGEYNNYSFIPEDGDIIITKYNGEDTVVNIPESIDNHPVTVISEDLFFENTSVTEVNIPKTVQHMGKSQWTFYGATSLENINVSNENTRFFSENGILFLYSHTTGKPIIAKYPESKENSTYFIPNNVTLINTQCFYNCDLDRIIIPNSVSLISYGAFFELNNTAIIIKQNNLQKFEEMVMSHSFTSLDNCTIIVKSETIRSELQEPSTGEKILNYCSTSSVKLPSELTNEEKTLFLTPITHFSIPENFKNISLLPQESVSVTYEIQPEYNTDSLTWSNSNPQVIDFSAENGTIQINGKTSGTATITGADESGHTVNINVTVTTPPSPEPEEDDKKPSSTEDNEPEKPSDESKEETKPPVKQTTQKITGVSSSYKKAYKSSFTLKPKAKTSCTYKSSNSKIATVNSKGKVTIKGTGKATITITAKATANYKSAAKKVTIYAVPAKMKTPAVKAGKKSLTVKWSRDSKADGYQIQYSTSSKFKKATTVTCSKKTVKKTIKKLKKGKKYYVRIRAYKKIGSKKYYGNYSKGKSVKVK